MSSISAGTTSTTTLVHSGDTTGSLVFKTNDTGSGGTTAVTIDTSQNVGIGTTSPTNKVQVSASSDDGIRISATSDTSLIFSETTANKNWKLKPSAGDFYWQYSATSYNSGYSSLMTLQASGNLLVGTTSSSIDNTAGVVVHPLFINIKTNDGTNPSIITNQIGFGATTCSFRYTNAEKGSISTSSTAVAFNTTSDYRLKENIAPMIGALAKVAQLKPVTYKWKSDGSDGQGFIAHELQEVVPDCVTGEKDAVDANGNPIYQGIDTSFLVATLTAAIQEQQAIINALTARVVALESK